MAGDDRMLVETQLGAQSSSKSAGSKKARSRGSATTLVFSALLIVSITMSMLLLKGVDQVRTAATLEEVLYISSPKLLEQLSLGYDGLLADIYWTRVVQYYGGMHRAGGGRYELLWPLLDITSHLDPHLTVTYEFGGTFLSANPPSGAGLPQRAIQLVEYGIQNNPDDWHLYYDLGFIYYEMKDYRAAADAFARGSQVPKAHPFLRIMAARMAEHGGETETAFMLWTATYQTTHDQNIRNNALAHLRALRAEEDIVHLQELVNSYRQRTGHIPRLAELVRSGLLPSTPVDPSMHPYQVDESGKVVVTDPDNLPFLQLGLPAGYVPSEIPKMPNAQ
jgi:tetratricopeptide (TPR) repeat protein